MIAMSSVLPQSAEKSTCEECTWQDTPCQSRQTTWRHDGRPRCSTWAAIPADNSHTHTHTHIQNANNVTEPAKIRFHQIQILYLKSVGFGCGFVT